LNGEIVPESRAKISLFDYGLQEGYGVFDVARTFNGKPFKLREHIERLFRSLSYSRIDPGLSPEEVEKISLKVLELNEGLRGENDDYWIIQTITKGDNWPLTPGSPTVAIYTVPLPFARWAKQYKEGVHAVITSIRRTSPECVDPKAKVLSRINLQLAQMEATRVESGAYALMLDLNGNVTEGPGVNFAIIKDGKLLSPTPYGILWGITLETVMELGREMGMEVVVCDFQAYDVYSADEAFFTTTSRCILPVTKIDGITLSKGVPGPSTRKLLRAWSGKVGIDIVEQALSHL
jgi:branched-chain amino acid aminotransferase